MSLNYVLKLKSLPENQAYSCVFEPENTKLFEESESKVPPLGIRILPHLEKSKLNLNLVDDAPSLDIIPWKLSVPAVRFDLASVKKDKQTQKYVNSSIYNLSLNTLYQKKKSPTVLKQRKELLRQLYPQNELKNLLHVGFQMTVQYSRVEGYSFSSQTCV